MHKRSVRLRITLLALAGCLLAAQGCAPASLPGARSVNIPTPTAAEERREAINERPDPVMYLPLGQDVLVPEVGADDPLPMDYVGPLELRSETLAGALQLILADYDVSLAFQTDEGLNRRITVANLRGPLGNVVKEVCSLANLYCAYQNGLLIIKETQTFTVKVPPISQDAAFMQNVALGLQAIIGKAPVIDQSTRTIIYEATQRNAEMAERYFQRMRTSTALIVFETYIWEVQLNAGNSAGIQWSLIDNVGKYVGSFGVTGQIGADFTNPISIGLPTTQGADGGTFTPTDVVDFLSNFGAVKTISQPQITVLSGSQAKLRAANKENYVAEVSETIDSGQSTTSVNTDSVDTGFTLTIGSAWDNATVYANIEILLSDVAEIEDFAFSSGTGGATTVQLPKTTERELTTQVRIRPGDSLLIAGLVRENDNFSSSGVGFMKPIIPSQRTAQTENLELVFLLRPRVIVFTSPTEREQMNAVRGVARQEGFDYDFSPLKGAAAPQEPILPPGQPASLSTTVPVATVPATSAATVPTLPPAATTTVTVTGSRAPATPYSRPAPLPTATTRPQISPQVSADPLPLGSVSSDLLNPGGVQ